MSAASTDFSPADTAAYPQSLRPPQNATDDGGAADPLALFEDAIDEVHTRFVLNVPESELRRADRILFQIEQAWWFYEDFLVDGSRRPLAQDQLPQDGQGEALGEPVLPSMNFKQFAAHMFEYSPLLESSRFPAMWYEFTLYKKKIGTYGCILLSPDSQKVVLIQLWNSKTHTFPAGKINQGEDPYEAAVRETYEETGFDVSCRQGLTAEWRETCPERITWKVSAKPDDSSALSFQEESGKRRTCYVVAGVPLDFPFGAIVRKEVSGVGWHSLDSLPRPSYAVHPFISQLRRWIDQNVKPAQSASGGKGKKSNTPKRERSNPRDRRSTSRGKNAGGATPARQRNRSNSRASSTLSAEDDLVASGLAAEGDPADAAGWSEEDMFRTNEALLGRKITYDGNPHAFSEGGFMGGQDPHAFHVVGGAFLNTDGGIAKLAPAPRESQLQPLFRTPSSAGRALDEEDQFTPFFSNEGATPWGEVVADARAGSTGGGGGNRAAPSIAATSAPAKAPAETPATPDDGSGSILLKLLHQSVDAGGASAGTHGRDKKKAARKATATTSGDGGGGGGGTLLTDAQITAQSQATKATAQQLAGLRRSDAAAPPAKEPPPSSFREAVAAQYEEDMQYIRDWVSRLPMPSTLGGSSSSSSTNGNGGPAFRLDADSIMAELEPIFRQGQ